MIIQATKRQLRQEFRSKRSQINSRERQSAPIAILQSLMHDHFFQQSKHIACYLPYRDELDTRPIIHAICEAHKKCYLPILTSTATLQFVLYHLDDELILNRYGIFEPKERHQTITADQLDMVLMPLIAFDQMGIRLGTGGGYYDKTFAFLKNKKTSEDEILKPRLVGVAYAIQETPVLPQENWDINMHSVITEQKIIEFK